MQAFEKEISFLGCVDNAACAFWSAFEHVGRMLGEQSHPLSRFQYKGGTPNQRIHSEEEFYLSTRCGYLRTTLYIEHLYHRHDLFRHFQFLDDIRQQLQLVLEGLDLHVGDVRSSGVRFTLVY